MYFNLYNEDNSSVGEGLKILFFAVVLYEK